MSKNEYLNQFVEYLYNQEVRPSKATVKNYRADIGQFIRWFETKYQRGFEPQDTSYQIIEMYKTDKASGDISQRSIERHLSSLRKFFTFLKMEGHVPHSPFEQQIADNKKHEVDPYRIKDFKNYLYVY
ncbi:MAG TPA: site-specific integrase, partial [Patescibacteria group bacterium]|nr:site-specific integrase [Patescibacteria group bacterium]